MQVQDLSVLAEQLRKEGFDARNLGQVGITVWEGSHGCFLSADELRQLAGPLPPLDFYAELKNRAHANGGAKAS